MNRMLVEAFMVKVVLMRNLVEMRYIFLGNAGKAIIYKTAKSLAELYLCPVFWKVELVNSESGYPAEDISKQSVKGAAWFLLNACNYRGEK